MVTKISAGLLMYRGNSENLEVLLAHPGGPFWKKKDDGAWTIPKGCIEKDEEPIAAAIREFHEEIGIPSKGPFQELGAIRQLGGKIVHAWCFRTNLRKPIVVNSTLFKMEWPPHSGKFGEFPEVDRAEFFTIDQAKQKILESQIPFLDRLNELIQKSEDDVLQ